jgi:ABC-type branched-subunit amino acid transport system substrate-binding protein
MRRSSKKLPTDPNQLAAEIVRRSTEGHAQETAKAVPSPISQYLAKIGRQGGLKGGKARAAKLTSKRRTEIAKKAAKKRWKLKD